MRIIPGAKKEARLAQASNRQPPSNQHKIPIIGARLKAFPGQRLFSLKILEQSLITQKKKARFWRASE
jgi:hypothetical protein